MYYINDSITSITTKWLSQLLQKEETNKLWSWGKAEKSRFGKIQNLVLKNKIVVQIYWTHVRPPAGAPDWQSGQMYIDDISRMYYTVWNCCHLVDIVIWFDLWFAHHCKTPKTASRLSWGKTLSRELTSLLQGGPKILHCLAYKSYSTTVQTMTVQKTTHV